jgi:hypothetical protein
MRPDPLSVGLYQRFYELSLAMASDLTADCFDLAREVRELDMRAAPYDLRPLGYEPVTIKTPKGKATHVEALRDFASRAGVLRRRLLDTADTVLTSALGG